MADEKRMTSEEMVRQAKQRFEKPRRANHVTADDIETEAIEAEVAQEMPVVAPTATRPSRPNTPRPRRRRAETQPADPFGGDRRGARPNQAVAAAISLAVFILGLAVFLAFVSVGP